MGAYLCSKLIFMNTKNINTEYHHKSAFASNENLDTLAAAGWSFARPILFSSRLYNESRREKIHGYIRRFMASAGDPYKAYLEFCLRILLALDHIARYEKGLLTTGAPVWFNPSFSEGFARTEPMYERYLQKKTGRSLWGKNWKALTESVLDITEDATTENFEYWINWFRQRRAWVQLYLFLQAHTYNNFRNLVYEKLS